MKMKNQPIYGAGSLSDLAEYYFDDSWCIPPYVSRTGTDDLKNYAEVICGMTSPGRN